ncbi:MAG: ribbon-helix-helix domain-containing protein [candidate division Zixibacteria bacterium]|nr:ribbon-helix-helix domain-containing protein [candidate division Zixibacteria bacterium]
MVKRKSEIVTFKVDESLLEALKGIPNRSSFIRSALLAALDSTCPLCMGTGILTPSQRDHWDQFNESHQVEECSDCHELHLVCSRESAPRLQKNK